MTVEALNCPNCGAGVASDSTKCEFCRTRLKTMACPSCFGLMFVGTEFCGHCGKGMVVAAVSKSDDLGDCPRCKLKLDNLEIAATTFRECHKCNGLWSDVATFEHLCSTNVNNRSYSALWVTAFETLNPWQRSATSPAPTANS